MTTHRLTIKVAEIVPDPGPRYRTQGRGSGEEFRDEYLLPKFKEAVHKGERLLVDLDGAEFGYPTSFLEEAFGGLARKLGIDSVLATLEFKSVAEPMLDEEIRRYIRRAHEAGPINP